MKDTYYIISEVDKRQPDEMHSSYWPKVVGYSFNAKKILLLEGSGHGLMGGTVPLSIFNVSDWDDVFQATNTKWFSQSILDGTLENLPDEKGLVIFLKRNGVTIKTMDY